MDELMRLIQMEIQLTGYGDLIAGGVVLTGGGSLLPGVAELTEEIFGCPVRIANPRFITNLEERKELEQPLYSTVVGLAKYGLLQRNKRDTFGPPMLGVLGKFLGRVQGWVRNTL
jgi:cell division protein FtsA